MFRAAKPNSCQASLFAKGSAHQEVIRVIKVTKDIKETKATKGIKEIEVVPLASRYHTMVSLITRWGIGTCIPEITRFILC